ncbi:FAD-dependent monooxygenase [Alkalicoccus saliphilus]|jgi:3-hydroxybenzoate 6-monooxygenase|uniref:3-hydroxybenzoate 6-hydroxylase n=1 Tax=Alkalicoccus saliphilus TaxID=200989 RepID=A0A2T4U3L3_9BACI|nr:FAD-dependent monooxygenase [Alkalicoccus saliphilus]PTL38001.1 3-hydroxybenzoate 6-hydroxylase [Alkalicoccus saliphilus]
MKGQNSKELIIVGGGIGGLAAAIGASEAGQKVQVLEQAPEFGEIGAGLQLAPNAMAVLDRFGLTTEIDKYAVYPNRLVLRDAQTGEELSALDLGEEFKKKYGHPYIVMHRSDLHKVLLEACEADKNITLTTNAMIQEVDLRDENVKVVNQAGEDFEADYVIGADGLWSTTRQYVQKDEAVCSEYVAYRGTIPMEEISNEANLEDVIMWIGPNLHLVQYPVRRKELYNQVAVFKTYNYKPDSEDWGTPEELDRRFRDCCSTVKRAVEFINKARRWPMYDRLPIENWINGRMMLLGDAAHPMLQYLAQGACQALEDASCFADVLKEKGSENMEEVFKAVQKERQPRTALVQTRARTWGEILHAEDSITSLLRDSILKEREPNDFSHVDWLYSYFSEQKNSSVKESS